MDVRESNRKSSINHDISYANFQDGGYGWVICICSFLIFLITDGFIFSFGIIFIELLDYFHQSKSKTAMVGSILAGAPLLFGPVISTLINKWGIRRVAMAGAFLTSASMVTSVVAPSVDVLIFTYGVMGGLAIGLMYIPATLIIGFYFEKQRAFATGMATCGSGIGLFVFPPLCVYLINEYGWRGALLIIAGIILQCLVFAALFRPVQSEKVHTEPHRALDSVHHAANQDPKLYEDDITFIGEKTRETTHEIGSNTQSYSTEKYIQNGPIECFDSDSTNSRNGGLEQNYKNDKLSTSNCDNMTCHNNKYDTPNNAQDLEDHELKEIYTLKDVGETDTTTIIDKIHLALPGLILMKNPSFIMCVIMSSMWTAHCTVLTILPNHMILNGMSEKQASLLVSIIGITNIVGRLLSGFLADRCDCMFVNGMAMFFGAISNFIFPFTNSYILLATSAGLFGLGMGGWVTLRPIVLVDIVSLDRVTDAFGILAFFQGIAMCSGPPFAGLLYQLTQSYELPFLTVALSFLIGAAVCIPMRKLSPKRISDETHDITVTPT